MSLKVLVVDNELEDLEVTRLVLSVVRSLCQNGKTELKSFILQKLRMKIMKKSSIQLVWSVDHQNLPKYLIWLRGPPQSVVA